MLIPSTYKVFDQSILFNLILISSSLTISHFKIYTSISPDLKWLKESTWVGFPISTDGWKVWHQPPPILSAMTWIVLSVELDLIYSSALLSILMIIFLTHKSFYLLYHTGVRTSIKKCNFLGIFDTIWLIQVRRKRNDSPFM